MSYETMDTIMTMLVMYLVFRIPWLWGSERKANLLDVAVVVGLWIIWWLV